MLIGGGIPDNAIWDAIKFVSQQLSRYVLGDAEERALLAVRRAAFAASISGLAIAGMREDEHVITIMETLLGRPSIGSQLVSSVLARGGSPLSKVIDLAENAGFSTDQLALLDGTNFAQMLDAYYEVLAARISTEARKNGSALFNLYAVSSIDILLGRSGRSDGGDPEAVRRFMAHYVGTAERPSYFCGRDRELELLDAWIGGPQPYPPLLLTAPAGRGKSALVVRWALRQMDRPEPERPAVIFVPISLRFQTHTPESFFGILASQVGSLYNEDPPRPASAPDLREFANRLLRQRPPNGRPVLLIFDGLDEASGWTVGNDLFPSGGDHLHILAAARPLPEDSNALGWLRRLDWHERADVLLLDGLSLPDIGHLLNLDTVGPVASAVRATIADLVYQKTAGDPLLVELWAELLSRSRPIDATRLTMLQAAEPSLVGVFQTWWEGQREIWGTRRVLLEQAARTMLYCLAVARGPLTIRDLRGIAPTVFPDALLVSETARSLGRFIAGQGSAGGFAFCHPLIATYFAEDVLGPEDSGEWSERIVDYCVASYENWQQRGVPLTPYVVRHLTAHLEASRTRRELILGLATSKWFAAWTELLGEMSGFLDDMMAVIRIAQAVAAPDVATRAILMLAGFRAQGENLSVELILESYRRGLANLATCVARAGLLHKKDQVIVALAKLGDVAPEGQRDALYQRAFTSALATNDIRTFLIFLRAAPDYLVSLGIDALLSLSDRYYPDWAVRWLLFASDLDRIAANDRAVLVRRIERLLAEVLDEKVGEIIDLLPLVVGLNLPDRAHHLELALSHTPWHMASGGPSHSLERGDSWLREDEEPEETESFRPSRWGATVVRSLYRNCELRERHQVREIYLQMIAMMDLKDRVEAIAALPDLDVLPEVIQREIGAVENRIANLEPDDRSEMLATLLPVLSPDKKSLCIAQIRSCLATLKPDHFRRYYGGLAILEACPNPASYLPDVLVDVRNSTSGSDRARQLTTLSRFAPDTESAIIFNEAMEAAFQIDDKYWAEPSVLCFDMLACADVPAAVDVLERARASATEERWRPNYRLFDVIALGFDDREAVATFGALLRERELISIDDWLKTFSKDTPINPSDLLAWDKQSIDTLYRHKRLIKLTSVLGLQPEIVYEMREYLSRSRGLDRLAVLGHLMVLGAAPPGAEGVFLRARSAAKTDDPQEYAKRLTAIAECLPATMRSELLVEAYEAAWKIDHSWFRLKALSALIGLWPEEQAALSREVLGALTRSPSRYADCLVPVIDASNIEQMADVEAIMELHPYESVDLAYHFVKRAHLLGYHRQPAFNLVMDRLFEQLAAFPRGRAISALVSFGPVLRWRHGPDGVAAVRDSIEYCRQTWR